MNLGKRDRTKAKNPPFFLTNVALRIWVLLESRSNSIPLLSVKGLITWPFQSFQLLRFDRKVESFGLRLIQEFLVFRISRTIMYLFASPIVHIGRPPWDGPSPPLPETILPILSYSYLTSSSFAPWNSFSLSFKVFSFCINGITLACDEFQLRQLARISNSTSSDVTFDVTWGDLSTRIGGAQSSNGVLPIRILPWRSWKHVRAMRFCTLTVSLRMAISRVRWSFSTCRASKWAFTCANNNQMQFLLH